MTDSGQANDTPNDAPRIKPAEENAQSLRLRPDRPQVVRLSRKVLAGGSALLLVLISGAVYWALQGSRSRNAAPEELYATNHHNVADQLATLPKDYTEVPKGVPRLGPPLPGDLGRPIVAAQGASSSSPLGVDAEQQRVNQESEAARTSKVFVSTNVRPPAARTAANEARSNAATATDEALAQNGQDRKLAFLSETVDRRMTSPDRLARPASPFVVQAGTVIPAALITGIRSDLPGQITAQVTEAVYDSPTGRARLIPQGARLVGTYDSQLAFGQSRVLLVWTRLIMPNGRSIVLERQPGADAAGYSGLEDQVDKHWKELLGAAALSTLLAVGTEVNSGADTGSTNSDLIAALRRGAGDSANQTGQQLVRRNLNIQPTLTIRPGFLVRVIVNRDLVLEPYRG
ncbi:conjugal transfer protein TraI [Bradyrhizobium sacchari]|uniref:Type IV secretion system protein VirB10 n=1 Tax=Bradyrhizobium sacchari TaxID=1399419 RepID=A0A560JEN0_9BRAD|nr:TrbI/VirB10 family protein [Bradyrhizobium sacchari]OPZ00056.1 conjugal transfer protein TraI [Bradyrhizobium sacchari]TWB51377.1 type IV secretion system protein VirB10 [Bradyrhizobium sacchari]TWB69612.1 type IV secretion system protein VirB10 [Bradyrhizobium sacchari]